MTKKIVMRTGTGDVTFTVRSKKGENIDPSKIFRLSEVNLADEDFSGKNLMALLIGRSHFNHCRFENIKVSDDMCFGGGVTPSTYTDCSFDRSDLRGCAPGTARFVRCTFRDVILKGFRFFQCEFIDCIFSGKLKKVIFRGRPLESSQKLIGRSFNEFHGNDFSGVHFDDTCFRGGIDLSQQTLPVSDKYIYISDAMDCLQQLKDELRDVDMENLIKKIRAVKSYKTLTEEETFQATIDVWIRSHEEDILKDGQKQLFLIADELTSETLVLNRMIALFRKIAASQAHLK